MKNNLSKAQNATKSILQTLLNNNNLGSILKNSFGNNYDFLLANDILTQWQIGNFTNLPSILVLPTSDMFGAVGAYSINSNNIYY